MEELFMAALGAAGCRVLRAWPDSTVSTSIPGIRLSHHVAGLGAGHPRQKHVEVSHPSVARLVTQAAASAGKRSRATQGRDGPCSRVVWLAPSAPPWRPGHSAAARRQGGRPHRATAEPVGSSVGHPPAFLPLGSGAVIEDSDPSIRCRKPRLGHRLQARQLIAVSPRATARGDPGTTRARPGGPGPVCPAHRPGGGRSSFHFEPPAHRRPDELEIAEAPPTGSETQLIEKLRTASWCSARCRLAVAQSLPTLLVVPGIGGRELVIHRSRNLRQAIAGRGSASKKARRPSADQPSAGEGCCSSARGAFLPCLGFLRW